MAGSKGSIWVSLGLKTDQFSKGVSKAKGQMKGFKKETSLLQSSIKSFGGVLAGAFAFGAIKGFFDSSLDAYEEQILAQKKLENALGFTSTALQKQAAALQTQTRYGDEATMQMQAQLATLGLTEKQIFKLTPLVQDLAAQTGKPLSKAAKEVTSALSTGSTTLAKYGVELTASNTLAENFELTLEGLNESVGGAAQIMAKEGLGSAEQLSNAYGDLKESAGKLIVQGLEPLVPAITESVQAFQAMVDDENTSFFTKMLSVINPTIGALTELNYRTENIVKSSASLNQISGNTKKAIEVLTEAYHSGSITKEQYLQKGEELKQLAIDTAKSMSNLSEKVHGQAAAEEGLTKAQLKRIEASKKQLKQLEDQERKDVADEEEGFDFDQFKLDVPPDIFGDVEMPDLRPELEEEFARNIENRKRKLEELAAKTQLVSSTMANAFSAIGGAVISAFGQADSAGKQFLLSMGQMVIDLMAQALAASMANAITGATGAAAVAGPFAPAMLPATIATMVGAVIGAFAAIPAFADGGIISGPTLGLMGEYKGARNNPEVISPLDKLQSMMMNDGGMSGEVRFRIEGTTLVGVLEKQHKSNKYSR